MQKKSALHISYPAPGQMDEDALTLQQMVLENAEKDKSFPYHMAGEIARFLHFVSTMIWAFPLALMMRRKLRRNKKLNYILQFKALHQVRNNIEKGSFAYDTLLFRQSPLQLLQNKSHLANLVCLAILFGDEFIDGIAACHGKDNIRQILTDPGFHYYLRYKCKGDRLELYYEFDICKVLPLSVLGSVNHKYGINYTEFYDHLLFLLAELNRHVNKLPAGNKEEAALLICKACNKCFDTYKDDITEFREDYSFDELVQYQKTKDDDIIQVLLTLRAALLNKKKLHYQKQFASWGSMIRSMQLYDDMQDAAQDMDFQMNSLCYFAKNHFSHEWHWLVDNKCEVQKQEGLNLHAYICLHMPASVMMTMQYARNLSHTRLNWVQRKIQNYLWRKNWLGFNNHLLKEKAFCLSDIMQKEDTSIPLKWHFIQQHIMPVEHPLISGDMKWALGMDMALMDDELRNHLSKKITRKEKYFLTSCLVEFPVEKKAALARKVFGE
jgi:hypothetical protein